MHTLLGYLSEKPTVTLNCSSYITLNEGDDLLCTCRGEDGNPPANVTWYKDDVQIGRMGKEQKTLSLNNVNETQSGTYKCVAQTHTNAVFADEKSIETNVNCKNSQYSIQTIYIDSAQFYLHGLYSVC